ncbi:rCG61120 [Rattus norvegicus]|uniref:RCG61120 n=1 Tax=Rattus norvegicus TaxID=10116 RepID=A6KE63_RAT|nr:rCG61120 [Rattus norvegicus]
MLLLVSWESGTYRMPGGIPPSSQASACSVTSQQVTLKSWKVLCRAFTHPE